MKKRGVLAAALRSLLLLAVVWLAACGERENDPPLVSNENIGLALQQIVDNTVLSSVAKFKEEAGVFSSTASSFCAAPDLAALDALQVQWRRLFSAWYRLANFNFGPLNDDLVFPKYTFIDSLRLRGTNYLSTVRNEIADDINGDDTLDLAYFAGKTFQRVGLLALESAIFETVLAGNSAAADDVLAEFQANPRKCGVLTGLAALLSSHADYVQQGWLSNFKDSGKPYRQQFLDGELEDGSEPLTQLLVAIQEYLDYLRARNVVAVAAPLSGESWLAIGEAIAVVETVLEGSEGASLSLFGLMEAAGYQTVVIAVRETLADLKQAIVNRDSGDLAVQLGLLDGHFKREIPDSLEVELGVNFSDGD